LVLNAASQAPLMPADLRQRLAGARRFLLLNPPARPPVHRDAYCSAGAKPSVLWQPLDLLLQSGHLAPLGSLSALDAVAMGLDLDETLRRVEAAAPEVILLLVGEESRQQDLDFVARLRRRTRAVLVGSGDLLRFEPAAGLAAFAGLDGALLDFASDALAAAVRGDPRPREDLVLRDENPPARGNQVRVRGEVRYPMPRHDLFPWAYRLPFPGLERHASVLSSYGCPRRCAFCNVGEVGFALRPVADVASEFRAVAALGYRAVYLRDPTVNASRPHLEALCAALERDGNRLPWNAFAHAVPMDDELAARLARAGCRVLQLGVETADDDILEALGKGADSRAVDRAVHSAHRHGIKVVGHFIVGLPGEGTREVDRAVDRAVELGLDFAAFGVAAPRPGTAWSRDPALVAELRRRRERLADLARRANRRFYLRPGFVLGSLAGMKNPAELAHLARAGVDLVRTVAGAGAGRANEQQR